MTVSGMSQKRLSNLRNPRRKRSDPPVASTLTDSGCSMARAQPRNIARRLHSLPALKGLLDLSLMIPGRITAGLPEPVACTAEETVMSLIWVTGTTTTGRLQ